MSPGADRVRPVLRQSQVDGPGSSQDKPAPLTPALRALQRLLPWAMAAVFLSGVGGGVRLAVALGQPQPGFAAMWRKELYMFTVSYVTPPHWPGIAAGMRVNDHLLCIDGYTLPIKSTGQGPDQQSLQQTCANGAASYPQIFRQRLAAGRAAVSFLVERSDRLLIIERVPLLRLNLAMLAELVLPFFLLGLGLLAIAAVVYRAGPHEEINLVFAALTTALAGLMLDQFSALRLSPLVPDYWPVSLILQGLWLPFMGVLIFQLIALITTPDGLSPRTRRGLRAGYGLAAVVAALVLLTYVIDNQALTTPITWFSLLFCAAGSLLALAWGFLRLGTVYFSTNSRRTRRQTGLMALGIAVVFTTIVPLYLYYLTDVPLHRFVQSLPYVGLGGVALIAYAILRYQLFSSKSRVLTILVVTTLCVLIANLVYLLIGQRVGILPILAATLLTGLVLEARQGPMAFFNRLLRREVLDYRTVAQFSEQVGQLQELNSLLTGIRQPLHDSLDVEHTAVWLCDPAQPGQLRRFVNGTAIASMPVPEDLKMTLLAHPDPMRASQQQAQPLQALAADCEPIAVWAPLVERGEAAGLLGLGPRWTGEVYGERDLQLIGILARQMTLSILNARQLERLQAMSQLIAQAEENERRKIARELHDTILQFLLVLTYGLDDLKERQSALTGDIERWQERISAEAGQLRNLLSYLRAPELLVQQGLIPSLQKWLEQVQQETTMAIETDLAPEVEPLLSTEAKVAIYRVCREAVHNALKHSGGSRVVVRIWRDGESVRFSVEDDGHGFDVDPALAGGDKGYSSLKDLRIYVESVGGRLEVRSAHGEGTAIKGWQSNNRIDLVGETGNERS